MGHPRPCARARGPRAGRRRLRRMGNFTSSSRAVHRRIARKIKSKLVGQDQTSAISDKQLASKMLRGAGVLRDNMAQVLLNCGGVCDPLRMETGLASDLSEDRRVRATTRTCGAVLARGAARWRTFCNGGPPVTLGEVDGLEVSPSIRNSCGAQV